MRKPFEMWSPRWYGHWSLNSCDVWL